MRSEQKIKSQLIAINRRSSSFEVSQRLSDSNISNTLTQKIKNKNVLAYLA
jgi:hypothetical protein